MSVVRIDCLCECDACAKRFGVEVELATKLKDGVYIDFEDLVRDTVRGVGGGYTWGVRGKSTVDRMALSYSCTVQGGMLLCDVCSKKCDEVPVDRNLTIAEVRRCLNLDVTP